MQPTNTYYGGGAGPTNYQTPNRSLGRRKLLFIVALILLAVTVVLGAFSAISGGGSQQRLSDDFVKKFVASDVEATYALLTQETKSTQTLDEWSAKVNLTKGFFGEYKYAELIQDDSSQQVIEDETQSNVETHTYIARGKDGTYAFVVTVSKNKADKGVISFDSSAYIDVMKELK